MYFREIEVTNYKCFANTPPLRFHRGVNLIIGKNNVGKTALLEALSLRFAANPHRSVLTKPWRTSLLRGQSHADFIFTVTREEIIDRLASQRESRDVKLGLPQQDDPAWRDLGLAQYGDESAQRFTEWFFERDTFTFRLRREAFGDSSQANWYSLKNSYVEPNFEVWSPNTQSRGYCRFEFEPYTRQLRSYDFSQVNGGTEWGDDFLAILGARLDSHIYYFGAQRTPSEPCALGTNRSLDIDCRNLPEVLTNLYNNPLRGNEHTRLVREVLPEILQVGTRRGEQNLGEVVVWTDERALGRDELAFTLRESGTGVGHVLSILYLLLEASEGKTILIDEPQSFLHPGAARRLINLLQRETTQKHQLVIATHSPIVVSSSLAASVTLVSQMGSEAILEQLDMDQLQAQRRCLQAVGARLADLFGFDYVLWVEGMTEEVCFPLILRAFGTKDNGSTAVLAVQQTGDFDKSDSRNVIEIYNRLSHAYVGLVPTSVGFVFDRDTRTDKAVADLARQCGRIRFLSYRMYENYLLHPEAIAHVINESLGDDEPCTSQQVLEIINKLRQEKELFRPHSVVDDEKVWRVTIHGAKLLDRAFKDLTGGRLAYDKVQHGTALTQWMLGNAPDDIRPVFAILTELLS